MLPLGSEEMLAENHNDGKLAIVFMIVGTELIAYHFWMLLFSDGSAMSSINSKAKVDNKIRWHLFY